jgi:hypothetical protein
LPESLAYKKTILEVKITNQTTRRHKLEETYPRLMTCASDNAFKSIHYKVVSKLYGFLREEYKDPENVNMSRT